MPSTPSLSADGREVAWLSSDSQGCRLVVLDLERQGRRSLATAARPRSFMWSYLAGTGLVAADRAGREHTELHRVCTSTGAWTPLLSCSGAQARVAALSPARPAEVLVACNARDARDFDYDVVSLSTGARIRVLEGDGYAAAYFDSRFRPRLVETVEGDGSRRLWHVGTEPRRPFLIIPHSAALSSRFVHFSSGGDVAYFLLADGADGLRLVGLRCRRGLPATEVETLCRVRRADVLRVLSDPRTGRPDVVEVERFRPSTVALTAALAAPLRALRRRLGAEAQLLERRAGDRRWLVADHRRGALSGFYVHDPASGDLRALEAGLPRRGQGPARCRPCTVPLRDGQRAVTYVTWPARPPASGRNGGAAPPGVLLIHGGPWRRSHWRDDGRRQWLASQGYCVIEPNFRGSTGFGAAWVNAGDRQWGLRLQDDLEDALEWAIERGYVDPAHIGLVGASYGGYAALQLAATSARRFGCVVATAPVTDLAAFVEELPAAWGSAAPMVRRRVGDPALPRQRRQLQALSPVHHAAALDCPVLLVHGLNDSRVPPAMSTRMFMAVARAGGAATIVLLAGEGHEIVGASNRRAVDALTATFLDGCLRGRPAAWSPAFPAGMTVRHTPRAAAGVAAAASQGSPPC